MWSFLGSECMFFGTLIATYLRYRNGSLTGPYPQDVINVPVTWVATVILLLSSVAMVLALDAIKKDRLVATRYWLLAVIALGSTFLSFQAFEFHDFVSKGLTPATNLFGTTFFVLTGFHGAHVTIGVIWLVMFALTLAPDRTQRIGVILSLAGFYGIVLAILGGFLDVVTPLAGWPAAVVGMVGAVMLAGGIPMLIRTSTGASIRRRTESLELTALYWHFVDIVWFVIFTVVYLISGADGPRIIH